MNPRITLALAALILFGGALALWLRPSDTAAPTTASTSMEAPPPIAVTPVGTPKKSSPPPRDRKPAPTSERTSEAFYVLALNWFPSFCELKPGVSECRSDPSARFALHGLWPSGEYCGIDDDIRAIDEINDWDALPAIRVTDATWTALKRAMPGTRSQLERHEWVAHGSCAEVSQELYFKRAAALTEAVNASGVLDLFAENQGKKLTRAKVVAAFDKAFGKGAGQRVRLSCEDTSRGDIIDEITIALYGDAMGGVSFEQLIQTANPRDGGCPGGIVGD